MEIVFARVAGIDVHKRQVTVAVRVPKDQCNDGESRVQLVRRFPTFYGALREMAEWLRTDEITHVAMEATGVYWLVSGEMSLDAADRERKRREVGKPQAAT